MRYTHCLPIMTTIIQRSTFSKTRKGFRGSGWASTVPYTAYTYMQAYVLPQNRGNCVWLSTSSKRLNQSVWIFAHFSAIFSEHICSVYLHQIYDTVAPPGKNQQLGFRFRQLLREFQHKMLSRSSLNRLLNKIEQQWCMERWENRSHTRSARTAANIMFVGDLICSKAWRKFSQASGTSQW